MKLKVGEFWRTPADRIIEITKVTQNGARGRHILSNVKLVIDRLDRAYADFDDYYIRTPDNDPISLETNPLTIARYLWENEDEDGV